MPASGYSAASCAAAMSASVGRARAEQCVFLLCDIQERFRDKILNMAHVIQVAKTMLAAADLFKVPVVVTEQYPKGLLHTVAELDVSKAKVFEKELFSMCTDEVLSHLNSELKDRKVAVLFGIETHVCVQQTAMALVELGYQVHILADGVSSQRAMDRDVALDRMRQFGVFVTTFESFLMELTRGKQAEQFKPVSGLLKAHAEELAKL
eukprot:TRINITY_DN30119_c0_g1_i1.p1 TRINITY_DN30119_c0_g1~~TRINITY_DN30119_c0_g1_i1.p1  ORF type:complete len:208 (-),score=55.58 TRINITY_DN30119_c0_g1_i1:200-823(-)